jgi:hypothetical protein
MKGATISGRWGVSVDLIPVLKSGKLLPKSTPRNLALDVTIDPVDASGIVQEWHAFPRSESDKKINDVAVAVFDKASQEWPEMLTFEGLAATMECRAKAKFSRFSPDYYIQTNLARGLVLIAIGKIDQGEEHLLKFCSDFGIAPSSKPLVTAKESALAISRG